MQYFSLPCTYELLNVAASVGTTAKAICLSVDSEGGSSEPPQPYAFAAFNAANVATSTSRTHMISIRPKQQFNGSLNGLFIEPGVVSIIAGNQAVLTEILYDCTLTGGSWVDGNANSGVEVNTGATISVAGACVSAFFISSGGGASKTADTLGVNASFPLTLSFFGVAPKAMTVAITALTGTPDCRASFNWREWR